MNIKQLVEEVLYDLANDAEMSKVTNKIQVISRLLKNGSFNEWVDNEFIRGYSNKKKIPKHRKIQISDVRGNYMQPYYGGIMKYKDVSFPIVNLGNEHYYEIATIYVTETISSLQNNLKITKGNMHYSMSPREQILIQSIMPECQILTMHKVVSRQYFEEIIQSAQRQLIDLFVEFDNNIFDNEIDFNVMSRKKEIDKIVNKNIYTGVNIEGNGSAEIKDSTIVGGSNNTVNISSEDKKQLSDIIDKIEILSSEIQAEKEQVSAEILLIRSELNNKTTNPRIIRSAFNAIKGITIGVVANKITPLVDKGVLLISGFIQ